ncbi:MAG: tetratricopeptide repeat protein [Candidatus Helarchaeota archaeon]
MENNNVVRDYSEEYQISKDMFDSYNKSKILKEMGIKISKTNPEKALDYFQKSLRSIKKLRIKSKNDSLKKYYLKSELFFNIGKIYQELNDIKKALHFFKFASKACKRTENKILSAAIATSILSINFNLDYNNKSKENKIKNQIKFNWMFLMANILFGVLILIMIFLFFK